MGPGIRRDQATRDRSFERPTPPASSGSCCAASRRGRIREAGSGARLRRRRSAPKTASHGNINRIRPAALKELAAEGYQTVVVEPFPEAVNLFEWTPKWPVCLVFGHEREGVSPDL